MRWLFVLRANSETEIKIGGEAPEGILIARNLTATETEMPLIWLCRATNEEAANPPRLCLIAAALALLTACDDGPRGGPVYTLYRNEIGDGRVRVATFDAPEPADFNRQNCEIARDAFASREARTFRFSCERRGFQGNGDR